MATKKKGTSFAYPAISGKRYPKGSTVKKNKDGTVTIIPPKKGKKK